MKMKKQMEFFIESQAKQIAILHRANADLPLNGFYGELVGMCFMYELATKGLGWANYPSSSALAKEFLKEACGKEGVDFEEVKKRIR